SGSIWHIMGEQSYLPALSNLYAIINNGILNNIDLNLTHPFGGALVSSDRPFHFFLDQFYVVHFFSEKKSGIKFTEGNCFWRLEDAGISPSDILPFSKNKTY